MPELSGRWANACTGIPKWRREYLKEQRLRKISEATICAEMEKRVFIAARHRAIKREQTFGERLLALLKADPRGISNAQIARLLAYQLSTTSLMTGEMFQQGKLTRVWHTSVVGKDYWVYQAA